MVTPTHVRALANHRIHIRYSDGVEGEVDLSDLAGKGVFIAWETPGFFEQVTIGEHRQIRWNDDVELCPDALYMKLTGKSPRDYFATPSEPAHA